MPEKNEQDRVQISVVIGRAEKEAIRRIADEEGMAMSAFCREILVRETQALIRERNRSEEEAPG